MLEALTHNHLAIWPSVLSGTFVCYSVANYLHPKPPMKRIDFVLQNS